MTAEEKMMKELEPLATLAERFLRTYHSTREKLAAVSTAAGLPRSQGLSAEKKASLIGKRRRTIKGAGSG